MQRNRISKNAFEALLQLQKADAAAQALKASKPAKPVRLSKAAQKAMTAAGLELSSQMGIAQPKAVVAGEKHRKLDVMPKEPDQGPAFDWQAAVSVFNFVTASGLLLSPKSLKSASELAAQEKGVGVMVRRPSNSDASGFSSTVIGYLAKPEELPAEALASFQKLGRLDAQDRLRATEWPKCIDADVSNQKMVDIYGANAGFLIVERARSATELDKPVLAVLRPGAKPAL